MKRLILTTAIAAVAAAAIGSSAGPAAAEPVEVTVSQIICPDTYKPMWVNAGTSGDKNYNSAVCFKGKRYVDEVRVIKITLWLDSLGCAAPSFPVAGTINPEVDANLNGIICFDPAAKRPWTDDVATLAGLAL